MAKKATYPDWVEDYHKEGTSIKQIGDNYYLYEVSSKRIKDKKYPVVTQKYIGKITKDGITRTYSLRFIPGETIILTLKEALKINEIDNSLINIYGMIEENYFYPSNITDKQKELLIKKYNMKDLRIKL